MKARNSFVSNSSSSSFIIASKNGALTKEKIMKALRVGKESPLYEVAEEVAKVLLNADKIKVRDLLEDFAADNIKDLPKEYQKVCKIGKDIRYGSAADDDTPEESILCAMDIHYEDNDIIIEKEGGY